MNGSNATTTMMQAIRFLALLSALFAITVEAVEVTGRFSMLGSTAQAESGDVGYVTAESRVLTADQQSLRLMIDGVGEDHEWSIHAKAARKHQSGYVSPSIRSSDLFRYDDGSGAWLDDSNATDSTHAGYELDRAVYRYHFDTASLGIGRQPIDWGSGRFWQPLNVFGAFAPTDLDTDFKSGIDALSLDWYPSTFSSLSAAYVFSPQDNDLLEDSGALYYRHQVGVSSEMSLLAGSIVGNRAIGGSYESSWQGMGWRIEGAHYNLEESDEDALFWIAGIDYQFDNGTLIAAEWYENSRGATHVSDLASMQTDQLVLYGLQQQLGRQVLGITMAKDLTPLLHGGYTLLVSSLKDDEGKLSTSLLHQLNLTYSVSNESDLLLSLLMPNGRGLNQLDQVQSEFGHIPASLTLRLRFYF